VARRLAQLETRIRPGQCTCPGVVTMRWPEEVDPDTEGPATVTCPDCGGLRTRERLVMRWPEELET